MHEVAAIVEDLVRLGVRSGDVLMVHASLRKIGPVSQRAAGVVAAIDRAVGDAGTWMMTMGASDEWAWVNDRAEAEREGLLADAIPFDPFLTPAQEDVGVLAEVMRTTPGTFVSNHPEGRFGARGPRARDLLENVPWDHYYGEGSPLERILKLGVKVLRLGADIDTVTILHYAEYLAEVKSKRAVRRHRRVLWEAGPVTRTVDCLDDSRGIVEYDGPDYFGVILTAYCALEEGSRKKVTHGVVGNAPCDLLDGADLVAFGATWMTRNLGR